MHGVLLTVLLGVSVPVPGPDGWGPGDERGNGNTQSNATRQRCAMYLLDPRSQVYELGHELSATMPQGPFGDAPVSITHTPTAGIPFTRHAGNGEVFSGGLGSQGTQMDALGHFGYLEEAWPGPETGPFPADAVRYYNGFTQSQVKPTQDSRLLKLGMDKVPPVVTSAVMLDIARLRGRALNAGELVTRADLEAALSVQHLSWRGVLPGDAILVHTGWGKKWVDPAAPNQAEYYSEGPGLAVDAQDYLAARTVVLMALDNPFTDPVRSCQLTGACPPPPGTKPGLPFNVHHNNLARDGIYQLQNIKLDQMAEDGVYLSCTIVLPLRISGAAGSAVRPIAVGPPTARPAR